MKDDIIEIKFFIVNEYNSLLNLLKYKYLNIHFLEKY